MSLKLEQHEAVSIVIALINQEKIELPCLKKFNEFRAWELDKSSQDIEKAENALVTGDLFSKPNMQI